MVVVGAVVILRSGSVVKLVEEVELTTIIIHVNA